MTGLFLIDKPADITSHDVVDHIRALTGERRVGHAGTLDPFATGLLIVLVGRTATRKQTQFLQLDKTYKATLRLGATSTTHDPTGIIKHQTTTVISQNEIEAAIARYRGTSQQQPPQFSAKKIGGKKAYELARAGKHAPLTPKTVTVTTLNLLSYQWPDAIIETTVSSGTYIRALARDIGGTLGVGAYLTTLQRIAIGPFTLDEAVKLRDARKEDVRDITSALSQIPGASDG